MCRCASPRGSKCRFPKFTAWRRSIRSSRSNRAASTSSACYVKGSKNILERLAKELDVKVGSTTKDGRFTLRDTRCLGACGLAPVIMINDDVYGRLVPDDIPAIIEKYRAM